MITNFKITITAILFSIITVNAQNDISDYSWERTVGEIAEYIKEAKPPIPAEYDGKILCRTTVNGNTITSKNMVVDNNKMLIETFPLKKVKKAYTSTNSQGVRVLTVVLTGEFVENDGGYPKRGSTFRRKFSRETNDKLEKLFDHIGELNGN
jgi:hypothetical protein